MSEDQKTPEENAASVLKEVNQNIKDNPDDNKPGDAQPSSGEAAEQIKGSDADMDQTVGYDNQPDSTAAEKQVKGSDADKD
jgi:hypothetical protein